MPQAVLFEDGVKGLAGVNRRERPGDLRLVALVGFRQSLQESRLRETGLLDGVLEERLGRSVRLHESIDARLIGGALVRYGDMVIDGSLRGRIERMAAVMSGA